MVQNTVKVDSVVVVAPSSFSSSPTKSLYILVIALHDLPAAELGNASNLCESCCCANLESPI